MYYILTNNKNQTLYSAAYVWQVTLNRNSSRQSPTKRIKGNVRNFDRSEIMIHTYLHMSFSAEDTISLAAHRLRFALLYSYEKSKSIPIVRRA